jgi:phosphoserine phosphatase
MSSAAFPGPSTSAEDTVLIFDLDGTILSVNSFQTWVLHMARGPFGLPPAARGMVAGRTVATMVLRKILRHDHPTTKRRLQRIWGEAVARETSAVAETTLVAALMAKVRPNLSLVLEHVASGKPAAILATAAVADYAAALSDRLGFVHLLCTPRHGEAGWRENLGTVKRDRVLAYLADQGWQTRRRIFFTDHRDDLPLIQAADLVLWFGSDEGWEAVRREAPATRIENCRDRDAAAVRQLALAAA